MMVFMVLSALTTGAIFPTQKKIGTLDDTFHISSYEKNNEQMFVLRHG